jgi:putative FmdB family regulatory protein
MPIYEYRRADGSVFEVMQKISDDALSVCPTTGQAVERLISQNAFHLKGGGWYKTDYAGKSSSGGAASPAGATTGESEGSTGAPPADASSTAGTTEAAAPTSGGGCASSCACH